MPKAKDKDLEPVEAPKEEILTVKDLVHIPKISVKAPKEKVYSFEQWAKLKNKPTRHLGGMKSFLGTRAQFKFPLAKWDEIFKAY